MATHKNCPNCAAPYDPALSKCPYCGTIYFDMSVIDFDTREPFWLKIRVNGAEITQYVWPEMGSIEVSADSYMAYGDLGNGVVAWHSTPPNVTTDISFHAMPTPDANIMATVTRVGGG